MNFTIRRRADVVVDVTPLIDIVFQLVLFFMVSTTFVTTPGIEVNLPRSSSDLLLRKKAEIKVWITAEGSVLIDKTPVDWAGLTHAFQQSQTKDASTLVVIKADKAVRHGRVVAIMDLARSMGLSNLAIATEADAVGGGSAGSGDGASGDGGDE